jgi:hypothetical protein
MGRGGLNQTCGNGAEGKPTAEEHEAWGAHGILP